MIILLTFTFVLTSFGSLLKTQTKGDFDLKCGDIKYSDSTKELSASCESSYATLWVVSEIDIAKIFANYPKAEEIGVDNSKTAEGCRLTEGKNTELDCSKSTCKKNTRYKVNLDDLVANVNGKLTPQTGGKFSLTCRNIEYKGGKLSAECESQPRSSQQISTLNLNNCIANIDGILKWRINGNYASNNSSNCRIIPSTSNAKKPYLACICRTNDLYTYTSCGINLSEGISYVNLFLKCDVINQSKKKLKKKFK